MHTATPDPRYPDALILSVMQGLMLQNLRTTKPLRMGQVIGHLTVGTPVVGVYHGGGFRVALMPRTIRGTPSPIVVKEHLKDEGFVQINKAERWLDLFRDYTWYAPVLNNRIAPYLGGIHD